MSCNLHSPKPWLIVLVLALFIVWLKPDLRALACSNEYHDNDHSLMPSSGSYVRWLCSGTQSSEEWMHPTEVGSMNSRSLHYWSWSMTMVTLSKYYVRCSPHILTYTEICCMVKPFPLTPVQTIHKHKDRLYQDFFKPFFVMSLSFFSTSLLEEMKGGVV